MKIKEVVDALEMFAPLPLQDGFDNAGLQIGLTDAEAAGALLCLDVTEAVVDEAISLGYNLIVSHHPLIFKGYKSITGKDYVERCIMKAIKHDIVIFSMHTNLDNAPQGSITKLPKDRFTERTDTGTQRKCTAEAGNICSCQTGRTSPSGTIQCRMRMYRQLRLMQL